MSDSNEKPRNRYPWTPEDDAIMSDFYPVEYASSLASRLGRSVGAVKMRAHQLGLVKSETRLNSRAKTSPAARAAIVERYAAGEKGSALAEAFGITVQRVYQLAKRAGVRKYNRDVDRG
jgi:hypothetical protein